MTMHDLIDHRVRVVVPRELMSIGEVDMASALRALPPLDDEMTMCRAMDLLDQAQARLARREAS